MSRIAMASSGLAWLLCSAGPGCASPVPGPFAAGIESFEPGDGAGFGQADLPGVVLGPPEGGGVEEGSVDVLSLGIGGTLTLELGVEATDGPGPDLIVFENPFRIAGANQLFTEPGAVSVSADGLTFVDFPCDPALPGPESGCAGFAPVYANRNNGIDPRDPALAGGDSFDLATVAMPRARFVRITDLGLGRDDGGGSAGFDLDAVAVARHVP